MLYYFFMIDTTELLPDERLIAAINSIDVFQIEDELIKFAAIGWRQLFD